MSSTSRTPSSDESIPITAIAGLSLADDAQAASTPKEIKASPEISLSTVTPADNTYETPLVVDGSGKQSTDPIFVKSQAGDDVFGGSDSNTPSHGIHTQPATIGKPQNSLGISSPSMQTPRPDRMNSPITPANAQGVLPPEACVFVANLATARTDEQLEIACHNHFDAFGECHVKVRRDKHQHPFALIQYYSVQNANNALRSSRDIVIDGRTIRTEHAQARRSVVLTRIGGGAIATEEAKGLLGGFGPISQMHPTTNHDARELGLPEGMWVQFAYYLDYKDALKAFNSTTTQYRIHVPPEVEARTHIGPTGSPIVKGFRTPRSTTDQKSIFVGNLPPDTTEHHLKHSFANCGIIKAVNIVHKPIQGGVGYNIFGFVEFSTVSEADAAAKMEIELDGVKVRVEPKEYSARLHTRLQHYSVAASPYYHAPQPIIHQTYSPPSIPIAFDPWGYSIHSPTRTSGGYNQFHNVQAMIPFHHVGAFPNMYATPTPSSHVGRRNEILYTGSPHGIPQWPQYIAASGYTNTMMQIPEEI